MKTYPFLVLGFLLVLLVASPILTHAQPKDLDDVVTIVETIVSWLARIFWFAAVGFTIYAGFLFLTAADNPERLKKAKHQLLYVVIAVAIALMSTTIPAFIKSVLTP